jgi:hypothetical protein
MPSTTPTRDQQFQTYADYGEGVRNNAKRGIELNERNGNKCATQTGKVRAQQLASGEGISLETVKRMHSYLSRAETYYDNADYQLRLRLHQLPPLGWQGGPWVEQEQTPRNLANSTKTPSNEEQVQARMDSLMMVITTLCDCIGAVEESNSPNAFAVKMKIVDKIDSLIDKIEY